ncbi:MAG: hypothetical protein AB1442_07750 [Nitrospirota bacterium]
MKEYLKSEYKPILIGILAYCILYAANELYGYLLIQTDIIKINATSESSNWHPLLIFSAIISTLLLVVPGFLAGLFSAQKGFTNGVFVIFVCIIVKFFVLSINHVSLSLDFYLFFILLQQLIMPVTIGAISGAAGQHNRNRKLGL